MDSVAARGRCARHRPAACVRRPSSLPRRLRSAQVEGDGDAPLTCLALVDSLGISDLDACARSRHHWERQGWRFPSSFPTRSSADRSTRSRSSTAKSCGRTSASSARIRSRACRSRARTCGARARRRSRATSLHLREGFIEAGGRPQAIADLVVRVGAGLRGAAAERRAAERRRAVRSRRRDARGRTRCRAARRHRHRRARARAAVDDPDDGRRTALSRIPRRGRAAGARRRQLACVDRCVNHEGHDDHEEHESRSASRDRRDFVRFVVSSFWSLLFAGGAAACAQELPQLTQPVNDFANVIDPASAAGDGRADPLAAAGERRRGRRRHRQDVRARTRTSGSTRSRCSRTAAAASASAARTTACSSCWRSKDRRGPGRSRLRPRAVHHRRVCRRDQPSVHGARVPPGRVRRRPPGGRVAHHRHGLPNAGTSRCRACGRIRRRAAPDTGSGGALLFALFVLFIVINALAGGRAGGGGSAAAVGRPVLERLAQRRRAVRRRVRRRRRWRRVRRWIWRVRRRPQRRRRRRSVLVAAQVTRLKLSLRRSAARPAKCS